MNLFSKLLKSTERDDFSTMPTSKKLEVTKSEILKNIHKKNVPLDRK